MTIRRTFLKSLMAAALLSFAAPTLFVAPAKAAQAVAIFAGGCFWCMEHPFDSVGGVISTTSGYTGGSASNPTYKQVSAGGSGHLEAIKVVYDPNRVSYDKLLDVFWRNVDPFDGGGQFCDRGSQYATAIFYTNSTQKKQAEASKALVKKRFGRNIVTPIRSARTFYAAEEYHQNYYRKNALKYKYYRSRCGRDARLAAVWG